MNMLDSYNRYFRDLYPILRDMSRRGIPISNEKRMELKALILREDERVTESIQAVVPPEVRSNKQKNGLKRNPILECEDCDYKGRGDHICGSGKSSESSTDEPISTVQTYRQLAQLNGLVEIEVPILVEEKCQCLKKNRSSCPICVGTGVVSAGTCLMRWANPTEFNPNSSQQVKRLIKHLKHPVPKHSKRTNEEGDAADTTEMAELSRLSKKTGHVVYEMLIQKRQLTKVDGVYCDGWAPQYDGRVRTTFGFGTATWQTASKSPNVQNGLVRGKTPFQQQLADAFAKMQCAEPGHLIANFDFKAFHVLTTGLEAESAQYMRLARLDMHSFLASEFLSNSDSSLKKADVMFVMSDAELREYLKWFKTDEVRKYVRDKQAKPTILGVGFGLGDRKLYDMNRDYFDSLAQVQKLKLTLKALFPEVFRWQETVKQKAAEEKRLVSRYGAVRHFFDVTRWSRKDQKWVSGDQAEQAIAFLPANHAFGHLRWTLLNMKAKGYDDRYEFINTIHDSIKAHPRVGLRDECERDVLEEMQRPSDVLVHPTLCPSGLSVESEATFGASNFDLH